MNRIDPDIENKSRITIQLLNDSLQLNANEPSLGLYRIQVNFFLQIKIFKILLFIFKEHLVKVIPKMVEKYEEFGELKTNINESMSMMHCNTDALSNLASSSEHFYVC